jgi:hypothetical protein
VEPSFAAFRRSFPPRGHEKRVAQDWAVSGSANLDRTRDEGDARTSSSLIAKLNSPRAVPVTVLFYCAALLFPQKPRELGEIRRNPLRLVFGKQLGSLFI